MKKLATLLFCTIIFCTSVFSKNIFVKNITELTQANANALPGDVVILKNGIWQNCLIELSCTGTAAQPVVFKAEKAGAVIIKGKSSLRISGNFIVVEGLLFEEGSAANGSVWEFRGGKTVANNCRITNCFINSFNNSSRLNENYWVAFYGKNNRVDHCNFINKTNLGVLMAIILDDDRSRLNSHSIDSNYFGLRKPLGSNGGEIIRVGVSEHCTFYSNTNIHNNLFENCDGETEIISIKSCGNNIRNNVFKTCQGAVVLRHGNNNTVEGNIFLGNGKEGTGGVRIINQGNWVVNNFFSNCKGEGFRSPLTVMNGVFNSPPNRYLPVRDAVIANNTFANCTNFSLGEGADAERTVEPRQVFFFNNLFYSDDKQLLYQSFSKTDSIYFKGNVISKNFIKPTPEGFLEENISQQKLDNIGFPITSMISFKNYQTDSLQKLAPTRLDNSFPSTAGCSNLAYFKKIVAGSGSIGVRWENISTNTEKKEVITIECKDAEELYQKLSGNAWAYHVTLTGNEYIFSKPLIINKNISFTSNSNTVRFTSSTNLNEVLAIEANNKLAINNLRIDAGALKATNFISTDSSGNCIHYDLSINNSQFSNVNATTFFKAAKHTYADSIIISNTVFKSSTCNFFSLKDEIDNKGFYNVEKMKIANCLFENNKGAIINVYRGGNDESTMGPKLFCINNTINNCNNSNALIILYGVQQTVLANNNFKQSNQQKELIKYTDIVKAKHEQKNNTFTNAGTITENNFVINLK